MFSPTQSLVPPYKPLPDDIPFAPGKKLFVDVPVNEKGFADIYIDDVINLGIDLPNTDNLKRLDSSVLLSIYVIARPLSPKEPIPRETMESRSKLEAEARAEEIKIVLGWQFDTRRLLISLPSNKAKAWINEIDEMLELKKAAAKRIERNIGRYVNIGQIIPEIHHFLNRLRCHQKKAEHRRNAVKLNEECIADLEFMKRVIQMAEKGIDMNTIAYRLPDRVYRNDSCPYGLGGYSDEGYAWRWEIPEELRFRASNNLLQHLANIVSPWVDIIAGRLTN